MATNILPNASNAEDQVSTTVAIDGVLTHNFKGTFAGCNFQLQSQKTGGSTWEPVPDYPLVRGPGAYNVELYGSNMRWQLKNYQSGTSVDIEGD